MELRQVIGSRRSMRFLLPYRPVEPEKIQRMLEAARIASHWGNVQSLRAVVVFKATAPKEVVEALLAPIAGYQIRYAPVVIVWYLETAAVDEQSDRLRELLGVGALGVGEGKEKELEEKIIPIFESMRENFKQPGLNEIDCGQGIAQATLMAFEQGLGTCCLGTPHGEQIRQNLGLPESARVLLLQTVGYPAESAEAGGQRPRQPFEELFQMNGYDQPFPRSKEVVEELKQDGMLQSPGPVAWREAELEYPQEALGAEAVQAATADSGLALEDLEAAYVGNAAAGLVTGQECIRGQVILRSIGLGKLPVINVENACASASTALHQAAAMVSAGLYDVVLALGVEKLYHADKKKSFGAFSGAVDVEAMQEIVQRLQENAKKSGASSGSSGAGEKRSMFMDIYAAAARGHMQQYGTTVEQFAGVSAKNSFHGSLNPRAQFREALSVEEVLAAPMIAEPLTRPMCSPIGDGAAAVVLVSEAKARQLGIQNPVKVVSSVLRSGWDHEYGEEGAGELCSREAYEESGAGPEDLDVVELHDASAPAEIMAYDYLALCTKGEGGKMIDEGVTRLGGRLPVNTSGGLLRKGHPVGATGIAQIVELAEQLQGRSGKRQVEGARIGLAQNGGGNIGPDVAAMCVTVLKA